MIIELYNTEALGDLDQRNFSRMMEVPILIKAYFRTGREELETGGICVILLHKKESYLSILERFLLFLFPIASTTVPN